VAQRENGTTARKNATGTWRLRGVAAQAMYLGSLELSPVEKAFHGCRHVEKYALHHLFLNSIARGPNY
jgi:hypothetical protein